ncbi:hypothetical protein HKD37_08G023339 [Glycine soja]
MERESNKSKQKQKLEVSDILSESVMIYFKNLNFIIFTFLTSIPLFCVMVYFEIYLQEILVKTSNIVNLPHESHDDDFTIFADYDFIDYRNSYRPDLIIDKFNKDYVLKLILIGFIYMVPLFVLYVAFAKVLRMYLEWSAMWNMSLVISVLEGIYGVDAFSSFDLFQQRMSQEGALFDDDFLCLGTSFEASMLPCWRL